MTANVTKVVAYGLTGKATGVRISKFVGYVLLVPGSESGVTAPDHRAFTYGQRTKQPGG